MHPCIPHRSVHGMSNSWIFSKRRVKIWLIRTLWWTVSNDDGMKMVAMGTNTKLLESSCQPLCRCQLKLCWRYMCNVWCQKSIIRVCAYIYKHKLYVNCSVITLSQYIICILCYRLDLDFHLQFHNLKLQYVLPYTVTEQFIQKWKLSSYIIFMFLHNCMHILILCGMQNKIFWNVAIVFFFHPYKLNLIKSNVLLTWYLKYILLHRRKKCIHVWNEMRVRNDFCANYPFFTLILNVFFPVVTLHNCSPRIY